MDCTLKKWSVAASSDQAIESDYCRLEVYEGELTSDLLEYYSRSAASGPTAALVMMGLRYTELDLPGVRSKAERPYNVLTLVVTSDCAVDDDERCAC